MKKYFLVMLLCIMPVFLGAWRRDLIKKEPLNKHQEQVVIPQEVQQPALEQDITKNDDLKIVGTDSVIQLPVEEQENEGAEIRGDELAESVVESPYIEEVVSIKDAPVVPLRPQLLYVGIAERDKKEVTALAKNLGFQSSSRLIFDVESFASYAVVVVSDMSKLRQIAPYADSCKKIVLWVRKRCADDEYTCIRELVAHENVRMVVCSPGERAYMRCKGIPVDRAVLILPSLPYPLRRALLKKILIPPRQRFRSQKVEQPVVEQVIKEDDVPKVSDTNLVDQLAIDPVEQKLNDITEIVADEPVESKVETVESKDEIIESTVETVQNEPIPEVEEVPVAPPPPPPLPRLLHIAAGERDKKELAGIIQDFEFECSACLTLDTELPASCDIVVISNMSQLRQMVPQVDAFKKIVLWVRGRCADDEYELIRDVASRENVRVVICTPYEKEYMKRKEIDVDRAVVIWPQYTSPSAFTGRSSLFLPSGLQESQLRRVIVACAAQGIRTRDEAHRGTAYCAASEGMLCFPGIMPDHLVFEHLQQGIVQFVPTIRFLKRFGFVSMDLVKTIHMSEWYSAEYADFIQYFNSWNDLKTKMQEVDYAAVAKKMQQLGLEDRNDAAVSWKELFEEITG